MIYDTIIARLPINKGWSCDKKYCVTTSDGTKYFLRTSDISEYDKKSAEYDRLKILADSSTLLPKLFELGICNEGKSVYIISEWLIGNDVDSLLPSLLESAQYSLGIKTGEALKKIHSVPAPLDHESWSIAFLLKLLFPI